MASWKKFSTTRSLSDCTTPSPQWFKDSVRIKNDYCVHSQIHRCEKPLRQTRECYQCSGHSSTFFNMYIANSSILSKLFGKVCWQCCFQGLHINYIFKAFLTLEKDMSKSCAITLGFQAICRNCISHRELFERLIFNWSSTSLQVSNGSCLQLAVARFFCVRVQSFIFNSIADAITFEPKLGTPDFTRACILT